MEGAGSSAASSDVTVVKTLDLHNVREVGDEAAWTLSSAKPGNGIDQLRDGDVRGLALGRVLHSRSRATACICV